MTIELILQSVFFSLFLGLFGIAFSDKLRIPGIIFFLIFGVIFGNNFLDLIHPSAFGDGLKIIITVFVSIILFEGGLSLNFQNITKLKIIFLKDIILSILLITGTSFFACRYLLNLSWEVSIVFSTLIIVTGPTVVKPIIRHIPIRGNVKEFLNGEAVLIDAIGAILSIITLEFVVSNQKLELAFLSFFKSIGVGIFVGILTGYSLKVLLTKISFFPKSSFNYLTLAIIFFSYWISQFLESESGLMTVLIAGIYISSIDYKIKNEILDFVEKITRIIVSFLFVLLSANFELNRIQQYIIPGMIIVGIIILSRFPVIFLSVKGQGFTFAEKFFISWIGPRGIIALSVASIAELKLNSHGIDQAEAIEVIVFLLILTTVIVQGLSADYLSKKLKITEKGTKNIIILGINEVTLFLASQLKHYSEIVFVDSNYQNCQKAKGFKVISGNAFEKSNYDEIDLDNFTTVLASTQNNEVNILFCRYLKNNFGFENLYVVLNEKESHQLSEIMQVEGIKLAFGANNFIHKYLDKNKSYFSKIKSLLTTNSDLIHSVKINKKEILNRLQKNDSFPESVILLLIKRNEQEFYIYHSEQKFELRDEIYFLSTETDFAEFKKLFES